MAFLAAVFYRSFRCASSRSMHVGPNASTSVPVLVGTSTQDTRRKAQAHAARRQQAAQADAASKKRTLVNETWSTLLCNKVQINAMHLLHSAASCLVPCTWSRQYQLSYKFSAGWCDCVCRVRLLRPCKPRPIAHLSPGGLWPALARRSLRERGRGSCRVVVVAP
jgi:hypothetical protein